ncbi:MAG: VWA domain-containing protein [Candidatus Margulisbacteria bacterium]|jgi:hypothetical protein|nr:VWA domain-containing protein [Candidatus Margulisiibacteriota bacterium]
MSKKVWSGLIGLACLALVVVPMFGCTVTSSTLKATIDSVTTIGTSEATLSGSVKYSGGTVDINLNAVVIGTGDAVSITTTNSRIKVGTDPTTITAGTPVTVTLPSDSKPVDIAFILDNTGSMGGAITGSKNSILAFAQSLEAAGINAQFGLVTYGDSPKHPTPPGVITDEGTPSYTDAYATREVAQLGTAAALQTVLGTVIADGGGDGTENPLDAIMWGYNHFAWRDGAQKVFIVITDIDGHSTIDGTLPSTSGGNRCTTSAEAVLAALSGKAVIHAVSPDYTYSLGRIVDVRRLADGLGEGRITAEAGTGGKWIEFNSSGFDLSTLGISNILAKSATLRFSYSFSSGTYYVLVEIDTNGDGIYDSNMLIKLTVASGSSVAMATFGPQPKATAAKVGAVAKPAGVYVPRPNN